jgi:hypothetical protein
MSAPRNNHGIRRITINGIEFVVDGIAVNTTMGGADLEIMVNPRKLGMYASHLVVERTQPDPALPSMPQPTTTGAMNTTVTIGGKLTGMIPAPPVVAQAARVPTVEPRPGIRHDAGCPYPYMDCIGTCGKDTQ